MATDPNERPAWQTDESLRTLTAQFATRPADIQVVSFDFFDTLVSRLCAEPPDVFIEVGRQLAQRNQLLLPLSPAEFRAARIAADREAREVAAERKKSTEIKLADIYQALKKVVRDPAAARDLEFDIERSFCYVNPAVASFVHQVRSLGLKTAILSDTYFTVAELTRLLRENGVSPSLFDAIIVSSERGAAKWNGMLYPELFRHFDIHPSELLHLGDNLHADMTMAEQFGVRTTYYYRTTPNLDVIFNGERRQRGTHIYPAGSLNSLRAMTARQSVSVEDPFRDGALTFGPLLTRYADWCVARFQAAGVRTVLALMREGELLGELVHRAAASAGVELNVVPCFVSRMSTARAAMSESSPEKVAELLEGSAGLNTQAVMDILGLGEEAARCLDAEARQKPLVSAESVAQLLHFIFQLPGMRQKIEAKRVESQQLAFDYLSGLTGGEQTVGTLDLGWSGSIQRNVARILRARGRAIRTVGCYLACTERSGRLALEGDEAHAYMDSNWARMTILPEVAINACFGSTDGYRREASGEVVPVLGPWEISARERQAKQRLREGILAFQAHWLALRANKGPAGLSPEVLADMDQNSAAILYRLLEYPTKPEADRLGVLTHDENYFGQNHSAPLCDDQSPLRLRREGAQSLFIASRCYWPQGVVARSNPRLVSALRSGWNNPEALGYLGAWHTGLAADPGLTDAERIALGLFLRGLAPAQVVFCGPSTAALDEVFRNLWATTTSDAAAPDGPARLIFAGAGAVGTEQPGVTKSCVTVSGELAEVATIRSIRAQLASTGDIVLVLTNDLPDAAVTAVLHGLAPFLGHQGMVMVPCSRFDPFTIATESPLAKTANEWFGNAGGELGYSLWFAPPDARLHASHWTLFRRTSAAVLWNRQWMATVADLAFASTAEATSTDSADLMSEVSASEQAT